MSAHALIRQSLVAAALAAVALIVPTTASASSAGRQDARAARGCGPCHSGATTANPAVTVTLSGPTNVEPGTTHNYQLTLSGGVLAKAGFSLSTSAGTLVPGTGTRLNPMGELVQSAAKERAMGAANVSFDFQLTAPAAAGTVTLNAVGNSVNGNGSQDAADLWNFAAPLTVTAAQQPVPDAGTPDAGPPDETDAGTPQETDAGTPGETADAGTHTGSVTDEDDGTDPTDLEETPGCNAAGGSLTLLALFASAFALRRRRS